MSGPKAYTMREMKGIVEYLVEHKAYGEIKGRKMWMDFSNSSPTTRTWQSLKETFLKRILPDIQNPYYRLTRDQVCSFRQGYDVAEREKNNRLEIRRSGEEGGTDAEKQKKSEQPLVVQTASIAAKSNEVDKTAGEDIQSEKITTRNRSSAETFILENNNRQSNDNSTEDLEANPKAPPKTMRDCIGFEESEPPPVVRAVLEDFGTDSEEESPMEIVESTKNDADENNANQKDVIVLEDENVELIEKSLIIVDGGKEVEVRPTLDPEIITEVSSNDLDNWLKECTEKVGEIRTENNDEANTEQEASNPTNVSSKEITSCVNKGSELVVEDSAPIVIENTEESAEILNKKSNENDSNNQDSLSATNDTIIPNNQELLNTEANKTNGMSIEASPKKVATRKRSTSQEQAENKKKKLKNGPEKTNGDIEATPPSANNTEALFEAHAETTVDNAQKTQDVPVIEECHENPCLKSVSLFEEQFNTTKYIDSEDEETPIAKNDVKLPEESILNFNKSSKQNHNVETVKNNESYKPTQLVEIVETTVTPTQNQKAVESQDNQSNIDLIPKEQDNVCMANIQKLDNKEVILEAVNETVQNTRKTRKNKHVLVLSSNSDSDEVERVTENYKERYKRLSQAFGFVPGTSRTAQRRRSFQNRRARLRTISRGHQESSDGDASYTDIDDAEAFVSPPHGRRNRRGRRYKKPESGRVVSLEEEGRLFVVFGNKVYPLVSDGKDLNYVHYDASDTEEESIWRQKYIDQKKKATELKKQIEQVKSEASSSRHRSPVLSSSSLRNCGGGTPTAVSAKSDNKDVRMNVAQNDSGKIQITLSNNNTDKINLEGHWPQVLPIMQQVMCMFYKPEVPTAVKENTNAAGDIPDVQQDISGQTTPIIPVASASRKVEELEREIFQEIEERGNSVETDKPEKISNVTKRKARAPSSSSEKSIKLTKISRKSKKSVDVKPEPIETDDIAKITESKTQDKPRESSVPLSISDAAPEDRSPSKDNLTTKASKKNEAGDKNKTKNNDKMGDKDNKAPRTYTLPPIEPRITRSRKSGNDTDTSTQSINKRGITKPKADTGDEVRYMLPPGPKSRKSAAKLTPTKSGSPENPHEISQDRFGNSVDSTQGYQDSDASPMKNITKRKKKLSFVVKKGKHYRRKSFPSVSVDELSLDSSNSSYFVPIKSFSHPTLDSEIYKTESYRILMGGRKLSITKLDAIEESSKTHDVEHCNAVSKISNDSLVIEIGTGSSSIVSLPFSPELSVVENLSISREMLQNVSHPTINEHQANDSVVSNLYNQYLIADVDASLPLMQQDCELINTPKEKQAKKVKKPKAPAKSPIKVSDLLNKVSSANITVNSTLSDTLDEKLRNLLLESAKKMTSKENLMEVDEPTEAKKGGKKRCSTPRKRITKKSKATIGPVIDEHRESCAKTGRQSCPPLSTFVPLDENANNSADVHLIPKKPARVKKDIIRVKIQRPKAKEVTDSNTSQASVYTDSGINESVSINEMFHGNDNVELIHNHSETCLQAHECIGNSIEFVEGSKSSLISLHSTESLQNELDGVMKDMEEMFEGQQSPSVEYESEEKCSEDIFATPVTTAYHSPIDHPNSSLITDDLSDEFPSPPTKWYLLSEEETTTGHAHKPEAMTSNMRSSNYLKQIFPIACAVPDLSTISEISKENEDSRKTLGEDTGSSGGLN